MDLLTTAQAADRLGVSLRTVHRLIDSGDLAYVTKLPTKTGSYLFAPEVIAAAVSKRAEAKVDRSPVAASP